MKKITKLVFIGSLIANFVLIFALVICWRQVWRVHVVNMQSQSLGLIVFHSKTTSEHKNLTEIIEKEGDKKNLEQMGIIFNNGNVTNQWGDRFELVQRFGDGKFSVQPVGSTFAWP